MLAQVQNVGSKSSFKLNLQQAEQQLFAALTHEVACLMDRSEKVTKMVEDAQLSQRDFIWFDKSDLLHRLSQSYFDWPTIIQDPHVNRLYHLITYIKTAYSLGLALKPVALHLV